MATDTIVKTTRRNNAGTLVNYDAVVAGDKAQTKVIERVRDGLIMVPYIAFDQAKVTNPSTGIYHVDITSFALDPTDEYKFWFTVTVDGQQYEIAETIQSADQSRTLRGYSRAMALTGLFGRYSLHKVTAVESDKRKVTCASLIDLDEDTELISSRHAGSFVYGASGTNLGEQRRVINSGFVPSSGSLITHREYPNAFAIGDLIEIHNKVPRVQDESTGALGWREIINRALAVCYRKVRLTFTCTVADQHFYDLADYAAWLTREDQIGSIYGPVTDTTKDTPDLHPGSAWLRIDAHRPKLEIAQAFDVNDVFYLDVAQPANTWIKSGGEWGFSTVGLQSDSDEALVEQVLLVQVAMGFAYEALAGATNQEKDRARWLEEAERQKVKAARLKGVFAQRLDPNARNTWNSPMAKGKGPTSGISGSRWVGGGSRIAGGVVRRTWR